jgi:hypothetical protein
MEMPPYGAYARPTKAESTRVSATANAIKPATPRGTTEYDAPREARARTRSSQRSREGCDGKDQNVCGHESSKAEMNYRVPGGPESSKEIGLPSGSTVISNRRKRQHWRSASTARAMMSNTSSPPAKRRRCPSGKSWCSWASRTSSASKPSRRAPSAARDRVQATGRSVIGGSHPIVTAGQRTGRQKADDWRPLHTGISNNRGFDQ